MPAPANLPARVPANQKLVPPARDGFHWRPGNARPLPGAVAHASVRFHQNYNAPSWLNVFASPTPITPKRFDTFGDAVAAARQLSAGERPGVGIFGGTDWHTGYYLHGLNAPNVSHLGQKQSTAPRVPYAPNSSSSEQHGSWGVTTIGFKALHPELRGIVDGEVVPVVSARG